MDNAGLQALTVELEQADQRVKRLVDPKFRGLMQGSEYEAARLFARIRELFKAAEGKERLCGFSNFKEWTAHFHRSTKFSTRSISYYTKVGRYLIRHVTEAELTTLGIRKAVILAEIARTGRLAPEFLKASSELSVQELDERAAPLLGRAGPWTERLHIDSHEAAQAALLTLGNWLEHETYTADRGKAYRDQKLGEIATLRELPRFTTDKIMESVSKIDVIWVKEDFPECFFEVEHTTEITMGLHRMFQALKFDAKFFIVAPPEARPRFDREIGKAPFKSAREKYRFRSYPEVESVFQKGKAYFEAYRSFFA